MQIIHNTAKKSYHKKELALHVSSLLKGFFRQIKEEEKKLKPLSKAEMCSVSSFIGYFFSFIMYVICVIIELNVSIFAPNWCGN